MKKLLAILSVAAVASCTTGPPSYAQNPATTTVCGPRAMWTEVLKEQFNMKWVGVGVLGSKTGVVEFYQSPNKHWAILVTDAKKMSCLIYGGTDWESVEPLMDGASHV